MCIRDSFYDFITADELKELMFNEIAEGTALSQQLVIDTIQYRSRKKPAHRMLDRSKSDLTKAVLNSFREKRMKSKTGAEYLCTIQSITKLDMSEFDGVEDLLITSMNDLEQGVRPKTSVANFALATKPDSADLVAAIYQTTLTPMHEDSPTAFIMDRLVELTPKQLSKCVPLVKQSDVYKEFKSRGPNKDGSEITLSGGQIWMFNLIQAFGENAKVFKEDFEEFEKWNIKAPEYEAATKMVLGK